MHTLWHRENKFWICIDAWEKEGDERKEIDLIWEAMHVFLCYIYIYILCVRDLGRV